MSEVASSYVLLILDFSPLRSYDIHAELNKVWVGKRFF
jgi:hypothetical protein